MVSNKDGSIEFLVGGVVFRFDKENYNKHILKRPKIQYELNQIEDTIADPDCTSRGPKAKSKKNFYKAISYSDSGGTRFITFWKVPVYYQSKTFAKIATAIYSTSPVVYVVNQLEENIWKKPNSLI